MIFVADHPPVPTTHSPSESVQGASGQKWVSSEEPNSETWMEADSEIKVLPIEGGNLLLRLYAPATLQINYQSKECRVDGWNLTVPLYEVHTLPRMMARRFLGLFSKAEESNLTEADEHDWVNIIQQIDYTSFSVDRAAPQYLEGVIVQKSPIFRVEWHDGEKEKLDPKVAASLSNLDKGENFGAFVKLGRNNKAKSIERISKLANV